MADFGVFRDLVMVYGFRFVVILLLVWLEVCCFGLVWLFYYAVGCVWWRCFMVTCAGLLVVMRIVVVGIGWCSLVCGYRFDLVVCVIVVLAVLFNSVDVVILLLVVYCYLLCQLALFGVWFVGCWLIVFWFVVGGCGCCLWCFVWIVAGC